MPAAIQARAERPRRRLTIHRQLLLALLGVNALVMLFTGALYYAEQKAALLEEMDERLSAVAVMAKEMLPPDYHDRITGQDSVSEAEYQKIVDRNNRLCKKLGLEYLWSLLLVDGKIVFTTSTSPDKVAANRKHATFFEPHSNPELYTNTFATMRTTIKGNVDKWGDIRVALVPYQDAQGRKFLFGSSVRTTEVARQLQEVVWQALAVGIVGFVFSTAVGLWVARRVTQPIIRLTDTIRAISTGRADLKADETGSVEMVMLARHFNLMNRFLQNRITDLETSQSQLVTRHDTEMRHVAGSLQRSEQRYRSMLNFAVDGILIGANNGIVTDANECACSLFGLPRKEIVGRHVTELPFSKECLAGNPFRFDLVHSGETTVREREILRRDGTTVIVEIHTKMMADGTLQSIYHDITERKRVEQALQKSEQRYKNLLNFAVDGILVCDKEGVICDANECLCSICGLSQAELLGKNVRELPFTPESVEQRPLRIDLVENGETVASERVVRRRDGSEVVVEMRTKKMPDGVHQSIWNDVTRRKSEEIALQESETRYRQLFEMESDALLLTDFESGRFLDVNLAAETMYGYSRDELLTKGLMDVVDDPEPARTIIQNSARSCSTIVRVDELLHKKKDGRVFPVEITARFYTMNGRLVFVSAVRDITERKRARELLESWNAELEKSVAERTAEVEKYAHQLQALTGRLARAEEAERQRIAGVLHEDLQQILVASRMTLGVAQQSAKEATARKALDSVDNMLAQSLRVTRSLVHDIAVPAVREGEIPFAVDWLRQQFEDKFNLAVDLTVEEGVQPVSENVYLCLYRAAQELLFNVVKHARVSRVAIDVRTLNKGGSVQIVVRDEGCGIAKDTAALAEKTNKGFGLFSIRERLEGMGGHMEVQSEAGRGTKVTLTAPIRG